MIQLKNITAQFNKTLILKNVSCSLQKGDFVTIIGPNGAGKTTLFDLIAGKLLLADGDICIDGKSVSKLDEVNRAHLVSRLFQNPHLNTVGSMTVEENLALATLKNKRAKLKNINGAFPHDVYEHILKPMNGSIDKLLKMPMGSLSGGQRQMIAIVMAIICPPKILLLDEPTAALDPQSATKVLMFISKVIRKQNITTLLITHDQKIATNMGNKLWVLKNGTIESELGCEKRTAELSQLMGEIDYKQLAAAA
jgi:putative ABC transport system ATP-binding protein